LKSSDDHDEARRLLPAPAFDEITDRAPHNGYLVFQGRIQEVREFLRTARG